MKPEQALARLCLRLGVPYPQAEHLLPLMRQAMQAQGAMRERLMEVVERNLTAKKAELAASRKLAGQLDQQYLVAVASVLHCWDPGPWFDRFR